MFKLPIGFIELKDLKPYCVEDHIEVYKKKDFLILNICLSKGEGEGFGWLEGEGMLAPMINLRNEIMMGDFRMLYLAFLKAKDLEGEFEDKEVDATKIKGPAIPPNLKKLSPALKAFIELFEVYEDLFKDAKRLSENKITNVKLDIEKLIPMLSEEEKNSFLISMANNEKNINIQLMKKLNQMQKGMQEMDGAKKKKRK